MAPAVWTPLAEDDLAEIAYYIAVEDERPVTARRIVEEIEAKAEQYAGHPELGQMNVSFPEGSLYVRHKRWAIVYKPHVDGIVVIRVVDLSRDFGNLFP